MRLFLPHTWSPPPQRGLLHHHPPSAQHTTCSGIQTQGKHRPRSPTGHPAQLPFWPILYTRGHLSAQNLHPKAPPPLPGAEPLCPSCPSAGDTVAEGFTHQCFSTWRSIHSPFIQCQALCRCWQQDGEQADCTLALPSGDGHPGSWETRICPC